MDARSGCCSHHSGVCGCGCCDGTGLSATCLPYYPECSGGGNTNSTVSVPVQSLPTNTPYPTYTPTPMPTNTPVPTNTPTIEPTREITPTPSVTDSQSSSGANGGTVLGMVMLFPIGIFALMYVLTKLKGKI